MAENTKNNQFDVLELFNRVRDIQRDGVNFKDLEREYALAVTRKKESRQRASDGYFRVAEPELSSLNEMRTGMLGTPIHMPVTINGLELPNEPLVTITGEKKIIRTSLTGVKNNANIVRRGTIKELINTNDYKIKITGRMVQDSGSNTYPTRVLGALKDLFETRSSVEIDSLLTGLFNIYRIAIVRINLPGEAGMLNNQFYEISAYSDEDEATDKVSLGLTDVVPE